MPTITFINPDDTVEVVDTPAPHLVVADRLRAPTLLEPRWTRYDGRQVQVYTEFGASDLNLSASALFLISHAPNMANASEYFLFGPVAIVEE